MINASIKAVAPWFGGKRTLAPEIVRELGEHRSYWEPMVGGFGVILSKPVASMETVNDLHGDIVNLARVVACEDAGPRLYDLLKTTVLCEDLYLEARDALEAEPLERIPAEPGAIADADITRAHRYFVASWAGRNGTAGTERVKYQVAVRWTHGGGSPGTRFTSAVDSLPAWHQRLRRVLILRRDAFELIDKIEDQEGAAIYVDPPYHFGGGRSGSAKYLYDFHRDDHEVLAERLGRFKKARVVVSYYDHPDLVKHFKGWTVRRVYTNKNLHVQNRRGSEKTVAPEVLLMNGPSRASLNLTHAARAETKEQDDE